MVDLRPCRNLIAEDGVMILPLIVNPKVVDGTPVYQLETAMGAAINIFNNSRRWWCPAALCPVKKN